LECEHRDLIALSNKATAPHRLVKRVKIILSLANGLPGFAVAKEQGLRESTVSKWLGRWLSRTDSCVQARLADNPRPGAPPKFSVEQRVAAVAIACQKPKSCGRPIEQWTLRELKSEIEGQKIVPSISERQVGRFLEESKLQPHRCRYWLTGRPDPDKEAKITDVCETYEKAKTVTDEAFFSVDEMTGIQALERAAVAQPMRPGHPKAIEFEYIRHGTTCLLGAWNISDGTIRGYCNPTRKEMDFVELIDQCLAETPGMKKHHFVLDNLNTHYSESLVCYVAEMEGDEQDLGIKGQSGILENMETRAAYLKDPSHSIVFHYTPKHASWLNQIEVWFSILVKKALRWASFKSVKELNQRILDFMEYFNRTMAKPFRWKYSG
jgi:transposase